MSDIKDPIKTLEDVKKTLMEQYAAAMRQQVSTLNDADKPKLQATIETLEREIQKVEVAIRKLQVDDENYHQYREYSKTWEDKLPQLNFKKSKKMIQEIFTDLEEQKEDQALFLLQRSPTMRADLCIKYIKMRLQEMGDWYPPFEYPFPRHQASDSVDFLKALARRFLIESEITNLQHYTTQILNKLCNSLTGGNTFFLMVEFLSR